jgi:hypothetical protein
MNTDHYTAEQKAILASHEAAFEMIRRLEAQQEAYRQRVVPMLHMFQEPHANRETERLRKEAVASLKNVYPKEYASYLSQANACRYS